LQAQLPALSLRPTIRDRSDAQAFDLPLETQLHMPQKFRELAQ
jgi:hypothetical protein